MTAIITTDAQVCAARATGERSDFNVDGVPGLRLRVTRAGTRTWRLESRRTGKVGLGSYPEVGLAEARRAALALLGGAMRKAVNHTAGGTVLAVRDRRTLRAVLEKYGEDRGAAVSSWPEQRRAVELRYGDYLAQPAGKLTADVIKTPVLRDRSVAAKRAARYLSTVLRHAEAGQPVPNSELDDLVPEAADERVLSDAEVRAVWLAADKLDPVWRDFTRGLLLTVKRRADLARARAEQVDAEAVVWHARIHKVHGPGVKVEAHPLSWQAEALFASREPAGGWLFATGDGKPLENNFDRTLKRLHRLSDTSGWSWHDLRRTARTLMGRAGVRPDIAERCLSHTLNGRSRMSDVYDMYDYGDDMRDAYQRLADAVDAIIARRPVARAR